MDHSHTLNIFNRINFLRVTREYKKKTKIIYQSNQSNKNGVFSKCSVI